MWDGWWLVRAIASCCMGRGSKRTCCFDALFASSKPPPFRVHFPASNNKLPQYSQFLFNWFFVHSFYIFFRKTPVVKISPLPSLPPSFLLTAHHAPSHTPPAQTFLLITSYLYAKDNRLRRQVETQTKSLYQTNSYISPVLNTWCRRGPSS